MTRPSSALSKVGTLLAVASVGILAACGSSDTPAKPATSSTTVPSATPTPTATWPDGDAKGTLANPYRIGEEIVDGDWSMTIEGVNLNAGAEVKALDTMMSQVEADPGKTWVTIHATWKYDGDQPDPNGATVFSLVPENWDGDIYGKEIYGTSANDVSRLGEGETEAAPAEKGFSDTGTAYLQAPVEVANDRAMLMVVVNYSAYNHFLVALD